MKTFLYSIYNVEMGTFYDYTINDFDLLSCTTLFFDSEKEAYRFKNNKWSPQLHNKITVKKVEAYYEEETSI